MLLDDFTESITETHDYYIKSLVMENLTLPLSCRGQESLEQSEDGESAETDNVQQTELSSEYLRKGLYGFGVFSGKFETKLYYFICNFLIFFLSYCCPTM